MLLGAMRYSLPALGLYLSDVLPTSYHAVTYTGVKKGDIVAIWGLGPIGFMASFWAFYKGAKRVIAIDNNWRTEYAKKKIMGLETINYATLPSDQTVPSKIRELVPGGVDVSIDATGGEYGKGVTHKMELSTGLEQDTSEMINEAIYSTRKFGRIGIIADYMGCEGSPAYPLYSNVLLMTRDCSYQPFQYRSPDGAWHYLSWLRPESCSQM